MKAMRKTTMSMQGILYVSTLNVFMYSVCMHQMMQDLVKPDHDGIDSH